MGELIWDFYLRYYDFKHQDIVIVPIRTPKTNSYESASFHARLHRITAGDMLMIKGIGELRVYMKNSGENATVFYCARRLFL